MTPDRWYRLLVLWAVVAGIGLTVLLVQAQGEADRQVTAPLPADAARDEIARLTVALADVKRDLAQAQARRDVVVHQAPPSFTLTKADLYQVVHDACRSVNSQALWR